MDLIPYLSTVILVATIATIVLAFLSYLVFKLRDRKRRPPKSETPGFFRRYLPSDPGKGEET